MIMRRVWAWAGIAAQIVFVGVWIAAAFWQGTGYNLMSQSISDMYAVTAPRGMILVVTITLCGLATIGFALGGLRPSLRPAGAIATVATLLLTASIYGMGDALTPFEREACRIADPGCGPDDQVANTGGALDAALSTVGIFLFVAAVFVLAAAMKRAPGWESLARPMRLAGIGFIVLLIAFVIGTAIGLNGLFERLLAAAGAAIITVLGLRVLRVSAQ